MSETEGDDALSINWSLVPAYANCKSDLHAVICFDGDELVLRVNIGRATQSHVANQAFFGIYGKDPSHRPRTYCDRYPNVEVRFSSVLRVRRPGPPSPSAEQARYEEC